MIHPAPICHILFVRFLSFLIQSLLRPRTICSPSCSETVFLFFVRPFPPVFRTDIETAAVGPVQPVSSGGGGTYCPFSRTEHLPPITFPTGFPFCTHLGPSSLFPIFQIFRNASATLPYISEMDEPSKCTNLAYL